MTAATHGGKVVLRDVVRGLGSCRSRYDCGLYFIGFETRSSHVAKSLQQRTDILLGSAFASNRHGAHRDNVRWAISVGTAFEVETDDEFAERIVDDLAATFDSIEDRTISMWLDVSSCSRKRLAAALLAIGAAPFDVELDILYVPGVYGGRAATSDLIAVAEPVLPQLAGWMVASKPLAAIAGLGFEHVQAMGALDYLDPGEAWFYRPVSADPNYDREIEMANSELLSRTPSDRLLDYEVARPDILFADLESFVAGLTRDHRVVLVPLGPKLFAAVSILVAWIHAPNVSVWRFSPGVLAPPVDVKPSRDAVGLRVGLPPGDRSGSEG